MLAWLHAVIPYVLPLALAATVTETGYVDARVTAAHDADAPLTSTADAPRLQLLAEGNLQLKVQATEAWQAFADVSLLYAQGGFYAAAGHDVADHDVPSARPSAAVSELYVAFKPSERLHLLLGKKRLTWGPGLLATVVDLLDPPRDPTDPTSQRSGAWLAQAELPAEKWTLTLVAAGAVRRQYAGLPTALVYDSAYPTAEAAQGAALDLRDSQPHFALLARAYALVANTDLNVIGAFTNGYGDGLLHRFHLGATASHAVGAFELHGEVEVHRGSGRLVVDPGCAASAAALAACVAAHRLPATQPYLDDGAVYAQALAGVRYQAESNGLVSVEYLFHGDGLSSAAFAREAQLLGSASALVARQPALAPALSSLLGQSSDAGVPQKFAFSALRRHYLLVSVSQPQIRDDFTLGLTALVSLEDLGSQLAPSLQWSAREWLTLTLAVYAPVAGPVGLATKSGGRPVFEYGLQPQDLRALVAARAFF
jgi:hypothetical protein